MRRFKYKIFDNIIIIKQQQQQQQKQQQLFIKILMIFTFLIVNYPLQVLCLNGNNHNNNELNKIEINNNYFVNNNDTIIFSSSSSSSGSSDVTTVSTSNSDDDLNLNLNFNNNNNLTAITTNSVINSLNIDRLNNENDNDHENNNSRNHDNRDKIQIHDINNKKFSEIFSTLPSFNAHSTIITVTEEIKPRKNGRILLNESENIYDRNSNSSNNNNFDFDDINNSSDAANNKNIQSGSSNSDNYNNNNDREDQLINHKLKNINSDNTISKTVLIYTPSQQQFIPTTKFNKTFTSIGRITTPEEYAKSLIFRYYKHGQLTYIADGINTELLDETGCNANDKFAFILHGWRQNCDVEWVPLLITKLTQYRGGCIICIDYGYFAQEPYVRLVRQYEPLTDLITEKLRYLHNQGFNPDKGYMFGFSYGGQLACTVGRKLGPKLIKEIDTCDMAGPGFDYKVNRLDHRDAAQNVQCIHTTRDKGTKYYTCHQDWRMGNCGFSQPAAKDPPKGSHGLCPYFYINAFEYAFYAIKQPDNCLSRRPANYWPDGFKMGYMESRKNLVNGELFAYTGAQYPFNVAITTTSTTTTTNNDTILNSNILNTNKIIHNHNNYNNYNNLNTLLNDLTLSTKTYSQQYSPTSSFIQQQHQKYPSSVQTQFIFYGTPTSTSTSSLSSSSPQIPNFRDRPVLNSIMRARKFLKRLQRNLRKRYSLYS